MMLVINLVLEIVSFSSDLQVESNLVALIIQYKLISITI